MQFFFDAETSQDAHTVSSSGRRELSQDLRWREIKSSGGLTVALSSAIMNPTMYPGGNPPPPQCSLPNIIQLLPAFL